MGAGASSYSGANSFPLSVTVVITSVDVSEGIRRAQAGSAEACNCSCDESPEEGEADRSQNERHADRCPECDLGRLLFHVALAEGSGPAATEEAARLLAKESKR